MGGTVLAARSTLSGFRAIFGRRENQFWYSTPRAEISMTTKSSLKHNYFREGGKRQDYIMSLFTHLTSGHVLVHWKTGKRLTLGKLDSWGR